jgi:8-oxo-dGTP diphosphatase
MARAAVLAAGGIVLRQEETPLIAVVRLRKRNEWVLPKGKLDDGETARDAAEREVLEETGHDVAVHEFLGTLVYESGGRFKAVHYWRMEAGGEPTHELMDDIKAVDWLPLDAAIERLSRGYERAFLENVGPIALESAALAQSARRARVKKQPAPEKRRRQPAVVPPPTLPVPDVPIVAVSDAVEIQSPVDLTTSEIGGSPIAVPFAQDISAQDISPQVIEATEGESRFDNETAVETAQSHRINLVQKVRDWLRRAA